MVTMTTAENALKSFYLDAVTEALDVKANPFFAHIKKTSSDVLGKDVRKLVKYGVNGGIGAGDENGNLPSANGNNYVQFVAPLKNLYGTIEITDKAVRASANNEGAFVNLLNDEMQGLIKSSEYNFGRMIFGDGTGKIATVSSVNGNVITVDSVKAVAEGMIVDMYSSAGASIATGRKVLSVDRDEKKVKVDGAAFTAQTLPASSTIHIQGSYGKEITGIEALFGSSATLYGVNRADNAWMKPYVKDDIGYFTETEVQTAIDEIEERSGSKINFIVCSWGVKRAMMDFYTQSRSFLPVEKIEGGATAITFNGIPVVADRFCPEGTMYLLNTDDFNLHQLCDWQWLEGEDGKILRQVAGKPVYTATLVKYAELICSRPNGQGKLSGINEV